MTACTGRCGRLTDRARIPQGATAVRLEPFDEQQITAWLTVWAQTNRAPLAGRGLDPLPADVALRYLELAEQPLLLLMLALYDADTNALQHRSTALGRTELYGRLLRDFARREIRKNSPALPRADLERAIDAELLRLSVVALAMFNRRSQWVPEADLDADFSALLLEKEPDAPEPGRRPERLTAAELTIGRFFFVHESRATQDNRKLLTYEFLHATFGEFLVAHLVVRVLDDMVAPEATSAPSRPGGTDSGLLHALLSFASLTARTPVVAFARDLLDQLDGRRRAAIADLLLGLHTWALFPQRRSAYARYEPLALSVTSRHAAWSANLVVLAVLAAEEVTGAQIFPGAPDPVSRWRAEAMIWRSQLAGYGWEGLHQTIELDRAWDGQRREILLRPRTGPFIPDHADMSWAFDISPTPKEDKEIYSSLVHDPLVSGRKINFACNMSEDIMSHNLASLTSSFPATFNVFIMLDNNRVISATNALLSAFCASYQEGPPAGSPHLDLATVASELAQAPNAADHYPLPLPEGGPGRPTVSCSPGHRIPRIPGTPSRPPSPPQNPRPEPDRPALPTWAIYLGSWDGSNAAAARATQ